MGAMRDLMGIARTDSGCGLSSGINTDMQLTASVRGNVQGVGFRVFVKWKAKGLMLRGFVENRADGSVYVLAAGERFALEQLLSDLRRGPLQARVASVDVEWSEETVQGLPSQFEVRH